MLVEQQNMLYLNGTEGKTNKTEYQKRTQGMKKKKHNKREKK